MSATVTVLYPRGEAFDLSYYLDSHMPLVGKLFGPYGLISWKILEFPSQDAPYQIQATLEFKDRAGVDEALKNEGGPVLGDIPNFTKAQAVLMIGDFKKEGKGGESK